MQTADLTIAEQLPTYFERREYLKLLAEAKLDTKYDLLHTDYVLMHSIGLDGLDENGRFSQPPPEVVINELVVKSASFFFVNLFTYKVALTQYAIQRCLMRHEPMPRSTISLRTM